MWAAVIIVLIGVLVFLGFFLWGKDRKAKEIARKIAGERSKDAEIAARPFVDNPTDTMRTKD